MNVFTTFPLAFKVDSLGIIFAAFVLIVFIAAGIYSFEYMKEERKKARYGIFFCLAMLVETVMCFAANMVTFYMCFELLTVTSMVLVVHEETKEAIMATLKYLLFSLSQLIHSPSASPHRCQTLHCRRIPLPRQAPSLSAPFPHIRA